MQKITEGKEIPDLLNRKKPIILNFYTEYIKRLYVVGVAHARWHIN